MATDFPRIFKEQLSFKFQDNLKIQNKYYILKMRKLYTTQLLNRPEIKFYLVLDYTLPSTRPKSTQVEIQNGGGSLGLVISLKIRSRLSHLLKRESLMFSLRQLP